MSEIRVVRSDGSVESDWHVHPWQPNDERVVVRKWDAGLDDFLVKAPRKELFDHWQEGGMARSTREMA